MYTRNTACVLYKGVAKNYCAVARLELKKIGDDVNEFAGKVIEQGKLF